MISMSLRLRQRQTIFSFFLQLLGSSACCGSPPSDMHTGIINMEGRGERHRKTGRGRACNPREERKEGRNLLRLAPANTYSFCPDSLIDA